MDFTFDDLPKQVQALHNKIDGLIRLHSQKEATEEEDEEVWFNMDELIAFLPQKYGKATIYGFTSRNQIPYYKKGKHTYFLKSEILDWLKKGKVRSNLSLDNQSLIK